MRTFYLSRDQVDALVRSDTSFPRRVHKKDTTTFRCGYQSCQFDIKVTGVKVSDWPDALVDHIFRESHYDVGRT